MISNFREILEKIISNQDKYFTGQNKKEDVQDSIKKSKVLSKSLLWKHVKEAE